MPARRIVLCLDGTDDTFGPRPVTNILKLFKLLSRDGDSQSLYYQPGLGTTLGVYPGNDGVTGRVHRRFMHLVDTGVAFSLPNHIAAAYRYLMNVYTPGDRVYVFGFSRGALAARILVSLVRLVGLLAPAQEELIASAWNLYLNSEHPHTAQMLSRFCALFSQSRFDFQFLGLWDSVNATGVLWDRHFPLVSVVDNVCTVRHAVSIDELRAKFQPALFSMASSCGGASVSVGSAPAGSAPAGSASAGYVPAATAARPRDFVELWFAGDHCDVGGGWQREPHACLLSDVSLRWMIAESWACGLQFCIHDLVQFSRASPSALSALAPVHNSLSLLPRSRSSSYAGRGARSLRQALVWQVMEIAPLLARRDPLLWGLSVHCLAPHLSAPRPVPADACLHWSVRWRLQHVSTYRPPNLARARLAVLATAPDDLAPVLASELAHSSTDGFQLTIS